MSFPKTCAIKTSYKYHTSSATLKHNICRLLNKI